MERFGFAADLTVDTASTDVGDTVMYCLVTDNMVLPKWRWLL